ncbi:MAG: NAD+ synthase, partial [Synechococcus sp.]
RILEAARQANGQTADLLITPELSLWGYPPRDLLLLQDRVKLQGRVLNGLSQALANEGIALTILVGAVEPTGDGFRPALYNAVVAVDAGGWRPVARKQLLPSYDVFDERRYFRPHEGPCLLKLSNDLRIGLTICEDLWVDPSLQGGRLAGPDPVAALVGEQPDLMINLAASPFSADKPALRDALVAQAAQRLGCPVVYLNQVGGNDELVFDGASFVMDALGSKQLQLNSCAEDLQTWTVGSKAGPPGQSSPSEANEPLELLFSVLVLGVRDYTRKCGFQRALLGLSGGIDSALVAVIAAAALGAENISALLMPSPWSSQGSIDDAEALASRLGLSTNTVPIQGLMEAFDPALEPALGGAPSGVTAENLQSRIRGTLLMAVANQQGQLLLTTGNKSELAVGYCTLYGDMNGGLAVIGDLYKTSVFALCDWIDSPQASACRARFGLPDQGELIGDAIRLKPPSAELRPDQKDSDSLPDYPLLDGLLRQMIEQRTSEATLIANGADPALVQRIAGLLKRAEFKRRQAAPLLKVSPQAFGSGWRLPIASS